MATDKHIASCEGRYTLDNYHLQTGWSGRIKCLLYTSTYFKGPPVAGGATDEACARFWRDPQNPKQEWAKLHVQKKIFYVTCPSHLPIIFPTYPQKKHTIAQQKNLGTQIFLNNTPLTPEVVKVSLFRSYFLFMAFLLRWILESHWATNRASEAGKSGKLGPASAKGGFSWWGGLATEFSHPDYVLVKVILRHLTIEYYWWRKKSNSQLRDIVDLICLPTDLRWFDRSLQLCRMTSRRRHQQ